jgi:hypothetical protein
MPRFENLGILNNADSGDNSMMQNKSIYIHSQYGGVPANFFHMKTNLNATNFMWMFEAVGYDYGQATSIRTSWVAHKSGAGLYQTGVVNISSGPFGAHNVYLSSDQCLVIVAYCPGSWQGFTLNAYNTAPNYNSPLDNGGMVTVTATAFSSSSTGVY